MSMIPTRVFFQKKGRLKYISHLDTMNVFQRAITRAGLPVWYTEGYNPHIYITFHLPLSLGYEGQRECFDIRLTRELPHEEALQALNAVLPEELAILEITDPIEDPKTIAWADYEISLYYPGLTKEEESETIASAWEEYLSQEEIVVDKKSKKGTQKINIAPYLELGQVASKGGLPTAQLLLATGSNFNVNPRLLVDGFSALLGREPEGVSVTRREIYTGTRKVFR